MSAVEKAMQFLNRNGVLATMTAEMEKENAVKHAALRLTKRTATKNYLRDLAAAEAVLKADDDKAAAAQKALDATIANILVDSEKRDAVRDAYRAITEPCDAAMLKCYDPRIDLFIDEMHAMKSAIPSLARSWPDHSVHTVAPNPQRMANNQKEMDIRLRAICYAIDEANRLKINEDFDDVTAALAAIRKSIPEA